MSWCPWGASTCVGGGECGDDVVRRRPASGDALRCLPRLHVDAHAVHRPGDGRAMSMPSWWIRCGATVLTRYIVSLSDRTAAKSRDVVPGRARRCRSRSTSRPTRTRSSSSSTRVATPGCARGTRPRATRRSSAALPSSSSSCPRRGPAARDLGGLPAGAARATVLSYASPLLSRAAIRALELVVEPGLVHLAGVDPAEWRHVGSLADTGLSPDRNSRVLLFVHGTFDSTVGAFGALAATEAGRDVPDPGARRLRRRRRLRPPDAERRPARERA